MENTLIVKDAHGNTLETGDSVIIIKDLKLGGSVLKQGLVGKNIRLTEDPTHIQTKLDGHGTVFLKTEFVKKKK